MIEITLNHLNSSFEVKDQIATAITIKRLTSSGFIPNPERIRLNMLDEKDLTIYSKPFSDFKAVKNNFEWELNQEFNFYDHLTISITSLDRNLDFEINVGFEKS